MEKDLATSVPANPDASEGAAEAIILLRLVAQDRDQAAYEKLFRLFEGPAINLSFRILGNRALAEEAVQEAMLRIWRFAHTFHWEGSVKSWIFRIVANQSLEISQKQGREQTNITGWTPQQNESNASNKSEHAEQISKLRQILDELPQAQRQLLALAHGAGMTHAEIASCLAMPRRTVSKKIQKALDTLRTTLSQAGVAAITSALLTEQLQEALCSGVPVTPDLCSKTLSRLAESGTEVSQRLAAGSLHTNTKLMMGVIGMSAVLIAGGGIWWANRLASPHPELPPPVNPIVEPPLRQIATPAHLQVPPPAQIWQSFPTEPRESFYFEPSRAVQDSEKRMRVEELHSGNGAGQWVLKQEAGGAFIQQVNSGLSEFSIVILGQPLEGAWEVSGCADFSESEVDRFATPAICHTLKGNLSIQVRTKSRSGFPKAHFRMWVQPIQDGIAIHTAWDEPSGKSIVTYTFPSEGRSYRLGFGSQTKVTFKDVRLRRLPDDWTLEKDSEIQALPKSSQEK